LNLRLNQTSRKASWVPVCRECFGGQLEQLTHSILFPAQAGAVRKLFVRAGESVPSSSASLTPFSLP
jgi:hypothetical protein